MTQGSWGEDRKHCAGVGEECFELNFLVTKIKYITHSIPSNLRPHEIGYVLSDLKGK